MQENKTETPMQNIQMMRVEPHEEEPSINIVMWSGVSTREDKWKQSKNGGGVRKVVEKEVGFDINRAKETLTEASTS